MELIEKKKIFMNPGKTNQEDRNNFIIYWTEYIKSHSDKDWSKQQNVLINAQLHSARHDIYLKRMGLREI